MRTKHINILTGILILVILGVIWIQQRIMQYPQLIEAEQICTILNGKILCEE